MPQRATRPVTGHRGARRLTVAAGCATALLAAFALSGCAQSSTALSQIDAAGPRVLVIAPHPDDETVATGGSIDLARRRGWDVTVVVVTNGDGFVSSQRKPGGPMPSGKTMLALGNRRAQEARRATAQLGVPSDHVIFLGFPDSRTTAMWTSNWDRNRPATGRTGATAVPYAFARTNHAPYGGSVLESALERVIRQTRPTTIVYPDPLDKHPDHRAVSAFAQAAIDQTGYRGVALTYLVHRKRFPVPLGERRGLPLEPPAALRHVGVTWLQVPLDHEALDTKSAALSEYHTQLAADGRLLVSFLRRTELLARPMDLRLASRSNASTSFAEPTADIPARRQFPAADIARVTLSRHAGAVRMTLRLSGPVSGKVAYGLHVRALRPHGTRMFDAAIRGGKVSVATPSATSISRGWRAPTAKDGTVALDLPIALTKGADALVVEADAVGIDGLAVDATAWRLVRLGGR